MQINCTTSVSVMGCVLLLSSEEKLPFGFVYVKREREVTFLKLFSCRSLSIDIFV